MSVTPVAGGRALVDRLVAATLYEGYILYPYRPTSVKNRVRWTFGGIHPQAYSAASGGTEPCRAQTECLVEGEDDARIQIAVRFLQPVTRSAARVTRVVAPEEVGLSDLEEVARLEVGDAVHLSWEEAVEREVELGTHDLAALATGVVRELTLPAETSIEPLIDGAARVAVGALVRYRQTLRVRITAGAEPVGDGLTRVRVDVVNQTPADRELTRRAAMLRSLVSTHVVLGVDGGRWLSLADPPGAACAAAKACSNVGLWPALVGPVGDDTTVLAAPIILEDHAEVAPESAGDLYDATEIDEILTLRILTLTDSERAEMRGADPRARALLDRTEALDSEALMRLHGTIRQQRPSPPGAAT